MDHKLAAEAAHETGVELVKFVRIVDEAVGMANYSARELASPPAANLATLYGLARYTAFLGRNKTPLEREDYVIAMSARFAAMVRAHLADPQLK